MKLKEQPIDAVHHAAIRTFLKKCGASDVQCDVAVGPAPAGQTRGQVERRLTAWLRTLLKAT